MRYMLLGEYSLAIRLQVSVFLLSATRDVNVTNETHLVGGVVEKELCFQNKIDPVYIFFFCAY